MFNVGDTVGKYQVLRIIGGGGMGAVVEVRDGAGHPYALKYCTIADADIRKRFKREVRIMAKIRHKHVVAVLDSDLDHDPPYFVMPLAVGTLADELPALCADLNAALDAFDQMCLGIQAVHNGGAYHRDIKPLNALRLADGRVVVSDLGLARLDDRDTTLLTQVGQFLGTRIYCAPEQLLPDGSRDADARTDIYQLGKSLYELLTGKSPALIDVKLVEPGIVYVIQKATKDDPDDRYGNIGLLMDAVKLYRESKDPAHNPREALENLLQQAKADLAKNEYNGDTVRTILHLFTNTKLSQDSIRDAFEDIPERLVPIIAESFCDELVPALQAYSKAVDDQAGGKPFHYAETIATRMQLFLKSCKNIDARVLTLKTALIAAVDLNRFAAMTTFNDMLRSIDPADDVPVADMLRSESARYARVAEQIPADRLPPAIRQAREEVVT